MSRHAAAAPDLFEMNDRPREREDAAHGSPGRRTFAEQLPRSSLAT